MFNVNADLFRLTALFVSSEEVRYYLQGVYIEPHPRGGALMTATDGHRLFVAHDESGSCDQPEIVKLDKAALAACKIGRRETVDRRLTGGDYASAATISIHDGGPVFAALHWRVDGNFPDWRRVLPKVGEGRVFGGYAGALLKDFATVAVALGSERGALRIETYQAGSPALVRFTQAHVFGVLMPLRMDEETGYPAFMEDLSPVTTKAETTETTAVAA